MISITIFIIFILLLLILSIVNFKVKFAPLWTSIFGVVVAVIFGVIIAISIRYLITDKYSEYSDTTIDVEAEDINSYPVASKYTINKVDDIFKVSDEVTTYPRVKYENQELPDNIASEYNLSGDEIFVELYLSIGNENMSMNCSYTTPYFVDNVQYFEYMFTMANEPYVTIFDADNFYVYPASSEKYIELY